MGQVLEVQVVQNEAEVGLTRTVVSQGHRLALGQGQVLHQLFDELVEVINLLELAARVLVELAVARQDVQLLQQPHGLPRPNLGRQNGDRCGAMGHGASRLFAGLGSLG